MNHTTSQNLQSTSVFTKAKKCWIVTTVDINLIAWLCKREISWSQPDLRVFQISQTKEPWVCVWTEEGSYPCEYSLPLSAKRQHRELHQDFQIYTLSGDHKLTLRPILLYKLLLETGGMCSQKHILSIGIGMFDVNCIVYLSCRVTRRYIDRVEILLLVLYRRHRLWQTITFEDHKICKLF